MSAQEIPVRDSIEFRDAVMTLKREGHPVYVRRVAQEWPVFQVLRGDPDTLMRSMNLSDFFDKAHPPVYMEDFAQALVLAARSGSEVPTMIVFTHRR